MTRSKAFLLAAALTFVSACGGLRDDLEQPVEPIGDFRLGHNIVVAEGATMGPLSREASDEMLEAGVRAAIEDRLRRYDGDGLYHVGVKVEGYVLAQPGIPLVFAPKSILIVAVNIWDNETQQRINPEPIRINAFEVAGGGVPFLPSGMTKSAEQQLDNLAFNAAREIENLLMENRETWFAPKPGRTRVAFPPVTDEATAGAVPPVN